MDKKSKTYLVIVESPGKIQKIEKILNKIFPKDKFIVKASYGHIIDLDKKTMSVDIGNNFTPSYYPIDSKKKEVIRGLKTTAGKVDEVLIATDEDREGEMIGWSIAKELGLKNPKRILFNSITEKDLKKAVNNPTVIDSHMVDSQKARRIMDRIVGFEISPILWKSARQSLSAGRVQSVVVKLITDKETDIQNFMKGNLSSFYKVDGDFKFKQDVLKCQLMINKEFDSEAESGESATNSGSDSGSESDPDTEDVSKSVYRGVKAKIKGQEDTENVMKKISKSTFQVASIAKKDKVRRASPPFTTSTLQQEAARKLGFSIKHTMASAQKLYEAGYITYMRTDSVNVSQEAIDKISKFVKSQYGDEYLEVKQYTTKKKNTQEAHEAVRPSDIDKKGIEMKGNISSSEVSLYNLIWKRSVASQMKPAKFSVTTVNIDISAVDKYYFANSFDKLTFPGFLAVYNYKNMNDSEDNYVMAVPTKGTKLMSNGVYAIQDYNRPPTRYNEASLVNKLDPKNLNIGRPSTYATIIDKIQTKKYVKKDTVEGIKKQTVNFSWDGSSTAIKKENQEIVIGKDTNKLIPTDTGFIITKFLVDYFPDIMKYDFTSNMEEDLDKIAEGSSEWVKVMGNFYDKFHPLVAKAGKKDINLFSDQDRNIGEDPKTKNQLIAGIGPYGHYVKMIDENGKNVGTAPIRDPCTKDNITLRAACELFEWPKILGTIDRKKVKFYRDGKYGPYVKVGTDSYTIKLDSGIKSTDIDLDYVKNLVKERKAKNLWEEKEGGSTYTIINGPYGIYVSVSNAKNKKPYTISLPKEIDLSKLTLSELKQVMDDRKNNKYKKRQLGKEAAKKEPVKKEPVKKVTLSGTKKKVITNKSKSKNKN